MDIQAILAIGGVAFGAGSFVMGALVTRNAISELKATIAENRRQDIDDIKAWVEERFQRKIA